jgi:hypothetical protein
MSGESAVGESLVSIERNARVALIAEGLAARASGAADKRPVTGRV